MMGDHILRPTLILSSYDSQKDLLGPQAEADRGDNDEQTMLPSGLLPFAYLLAPAPLHHPLSLSQRLGPQTCNTEVYLLIVKPSLRRDIASIFHNDVAVTFQVFT